MECKNCGNGVNQARAIPVLERSSGKPGDHFACRVCGRLHDEKGEPIFNSSLFEHYWDYKKGQVVVRGSLLFPKTWGVIKNILLTGDQELQAQETYIQKPGEAAPPSYLLWMLEKWWEMGPGDEIKVNRWLGWILAQMEFHGFWDNSKSRELVRSERHSS
jgi:hypothetical protein